MGRFTAVYVAFGAAVLTPALLLGGVRGWELVIAVAFSLVCCYGFGRVIGH